ncbi:mitochondrial 54S ribosomal protein YmL2 [Sugiyamaella lignohabitans]|uniref:Large ribosomal subunit protein bL27m n=1 Tax=Sugiyamaella lignohabitans TaxID=796027 RepID=A0A167CCT7_9ASCO|nr:mitochondrial 54S ribosomal protein YmL2 [Sugiyamaella lignohabitans]ANB11519.1 mitochondrial 54S ribosomal protein YmL2 [Sugiyamaella lignohabitans]
MASRLRQLIRPVFAVNSALSVSNAVRSPVLTFVRTATKRAAGSRTSMKDSAGRRLGMKKSDGEPVKAGQIIYRQRGTRFYPGENADIGKDHTIWAKEPGFVRYYYDPFHPKRRLIGVALSAKDQLPTPHFEPRKRRLGYVPLTNEKKVQEEKEWLSRKQTLALPTILAEVEKRKAARAERANKYASELTSLVEGLTEEEVSKSASRLVTIANYLAGGRTLAEARSFTDSEFVQDTRLAGELNKLAQDVTANTIESYQSLAAKIDAKVSFDANRNIVRAYSKTELSEMKTETLQKLAELSAEKPLSANTKEEILALLAKPCFSLSEQVAYRRKYTKPEPPTLIKDKEALSQYQKLEKDGKGKIVQSWNYAKRKVDRFFLPSGTSMFAIH